MAVYAYGVWVELLHCDCPACSGPAAEPQKAKLKLVKPKGAPRAILKRDPLERRAMLALRKMIIYGEIAPGELLPEGEFGQRLGISRTPLREALKSLSAEGLVDLHPNRRARVSELKIREVRELFDVISHLEGMAAGLAAEKIQPAMLERLRELQCQLEGCFEAEEIIEYFKINQTIHSMIVQAAGNTVLTATHKTLLGRAERARFMALQTPQRWTNSIHEHRDILECLKNGDSAAASRLTAQHVRWTGEIIIQRLARKSGFTKFEGDADIGAKL